MASTMKYPKTVTQTTGGSYVSWSNLNNIKVNSSGAYAVSNVLIKGKSSSPNRPSTITCTNFGFNLHVGAEPTKVIVEYNHMKLAGNQAPKTCNIPAPTISLVGVSGFSGKGVAPTTSFGNHTKTFNVTGKLTRSQVNSSNFGVKINYPTNANNIDGYMRVSYVRIIVEYKLSQYSFSVKKVNGGYNNEPYTVQLSISNKNRTNYNPTCTLTVPAGFSFDSSKGNGVVKKVNNTTFTWNPKLTSKVGTSSVNLVFVPSVVFPSGESSYSGVFTLSESLYGTAKTHTATITERPVTEDEEAPDSPLIVDDEEASVSNPEVHTVAVGEEFYLNIDTSDWDSETKEYALSGYSDPSFSIFDDGMDYSNSDFANDKLQFKLSGTDYGWFDFIGIMGILPTYYENGSINWTLKANEVGEYVILVSWRPVDSGSTGTFFKFVKVSCIPDEEDLTSPYFSILEPSEEELNRLGDGYPYIVQSDIKNTTTDTFIRDWYKNNRIGVFNNPITENITITTETIDGETIETVTDSTDYDNLTIEEIFNNAEYWSENVAGLNQYGNVECEFVYNENYPLYLIFTGDYLESTTYGYDVGQISFSNPCIIEKTVYSEREETGNYPYPIMNLITDDGISELEIPTPTTSTPVILYNPPLDDGYGNTSTTSIRGIEITGTIEQSDELVLYAKLTNPEGITGQRSVIINDYDRVNDSDNSFKIGGLGDLWGFKQNEIHDLEDWEIELTVSNILTDVDSNINFGDLQLIIYTEQLEEQDIEVSVEGENLSYYGVFIEDVNIPEGLKTDTDFLNIDGTDTNDAYRQNIREKTIELDLSITECDLQTSTDMLRQLTKLLVTEKDEYNRPIPKKIMFSHYPDVYFEYICQDTFDVSNNNGSYSIKAKLTVPSGTSYTRVATSTNIIGFVQGIASINPIISFKSMSESITIKELFSEQEFTMVYDGDWNDKIVEINCEDRIVYLLDSEDDSNPTDISKYVDFNSDWFILHGEYSFSAAGCTIRTVTFNERW